MAFPWFAPWHTRGEPIAHAPRTCGVPIAHQWHTRATRGIPRSRHVGRRSGVDVFRFESVRFVAAPRWHVYNLHPRIVFRWGANTWGGERVAAASAGLDDGGPIAVPIADCGIFIARGLPAASPQHPHSVPGMSHGRPAADTQFAHGHPTAGPYIRRRRMADTRQLLQIHGAPMPQWHAPMAQTWRTHGFGPPKAHSRRRHNYNGYLMQP